MNYFDHRVAAASRAICLRLRGVRRLALASPPFRLPSLESATAARFFWRLAGGSDFGCCFVDSRPTRTAFCQKSRPESGRLGAMLLIIRVSRGRWNGSFKLDHYRGPGVGSPRSEPSPGWPKRDIVVILSEGNEGLRGGSG